MAGDTTIANLPVRFQDNDNASEETCNVPMLSMNRMKQLSALHECIKGCLEPISDIAIRQLVCTTAE